MFKAEIQGHLDKEGVCYLTAPPFPLSLICCKHTMTDFSSIHAVDVSKSQRGSKIHSTFETFVEIKVSILHHK